MHLDVEPVITATFPEYLLHWHGGRLSLNFSMFHAEEWMLLASLSSQHIGWKYLRGWNVTSDPGDRSWSSTAEKWNWKLSNCQNSNAWMALHGDSYLPLEVSRDLIQMNSHESSTFRFPSMQMPHTIIFTLETISSDLLGRNRLRENGNSYSFRTTVSLSESNGQFLQA